MQPVMLIVGLGYMPLMSEAGLADAVAPAPQWYSLGAQVQVHVVDSGTGWQSLAKIVLRV